MILKLNDVKDLVIEENSNELVEHYNLLPDIQDYIKHLQNIDINFHTMRMPVDLIDSNTKELVDTKNEPEECSTIIAKTMKACSVDNVILLSDVVSMVVQECTRLNHNNIYWYKIYPTENNNLLVRFATA